jgi:hypothetical protein
MCPMESAKLLWMIGGFTVFPMAIGFSYLLRSDPFCKGNPWAVSWGWRMEA